MTPRINKVPAVFGQRIQRERERRGWSMAQLAIYSHVATSTVLHAEDGADAALSSAIAIAATLGLPLDELLAESVCPQCDGKAPAGFICLECGALGESV